MKCSECNEEAFAEFKFNEFDKKWIPLCYIHLAEHRLDIKKDTKEIIVTLSHELYEKIKSRFAVIRKKHNLTYLFNKSTENDSVLHHEWKGDKDEIKADYTLDKNKSTTDTKVVTDAIISYRYKLNSEFYKDMVGLLYSVLSHIEENTSSICDGDASKSTITTSSEISEEERIRNIFLSDMGIDISEWDKYESSGYNISFKPKRQKNMEFSDVYIIRTVEAIKKGLFKGR